ncbi:MAG: PKD domain-containing protein [Bacteroidia bacterium]
MKINILITCLIISAVFTACKEDDDAPPRATANFDFTNCKAPCTVNFINISQNATSYNWNFGDGTTSTETNPKHFYENAGTYNVKLEAAGEGGNHTREKEVVISAPVFRMKYKVDGILVEESTLVASRETPAGFMSISTSTNNNPPMFNFVIEKPTAGFTSNSTFNLYIGTAQGMANHIGLNNINYSSQYDSTGIDLNINYINYNNGGIVSGTFSGFVRSSGGITKQISEGEFKMTFSN